jgi:hypothetical protein
VYVDKLLTPYVKDGDLCYGYGVWMSMKNDEVLKYFVFGYDPGVRVHSSVNKKTKIQSHILSNIEQSIVPIVTGIDKVISESILGEQINKE